MNDARPFAPAGPLRSLGYRMLWICSDTFQKAANACLYLAAGLLRQDDLRTASLVRWTADGISAPDVDAGLEKWERHLYGEVLRPLDRVLLVGCGSGRDLFALCELGYNMTGLDQAPEVVNLAQHHLASRGLTATVLAGFVETVTLDDPYDVIVFSNGCYSSLQSFALRVATLARMKGRLTENGRIVIAYRGFEHQSPLSLWLTETSAHLARADWRPEPGDVFSRDHSGDRILRFDHRFRPGEMARECAAAGLRVIRDEATKPPLHCTVAVP